MWFAQSMNAGETGRTGGLRAPADERNPGADEQQWAARNVGGWLMLAAAVLVSGITLLSDLRHEPFEPVTRLLNYSLSALAVLLGIVLLRAASLVPNWVINVLPSVAALMVCIPTAIDKTPSPLGPLLLTWTVTFAAAVLTPRVAWTTLGVVVGCFAVIAAVARGVDGVVLWLEVSSALTVICWMVAQLQAQSNRLRARLANLARTDPLTGLLNRRAFDEALAREHARQQRGGPPLGVLLVDIDHFKQVNDSWGHQAGDQALRQLSELLTDCFRTMDVVGRLGGEEFGVLIPDCEPGQALVRARELCDTVRTRTRTWQHPITISVGVAWSAQAKYTPEELIAVADAGLYTAKASGRDQVSSTEQIPR